MELLEQRILQDGVVLPGHVLKVGSFLNHQIDFDLLLEMGAEIARRYAGEQITKILTVEASGIAVAAGVAAHLHRSILFAKKSSASNLDANLYHARVHSFTHGNDYDMVLEKTYLSQRDRVLLVDDFLAVGEALGGLISLTQQAGAALVGCAIAIEKAFQGGGDALRAQGIRVESLAMIEHMDDHSLTFRRP